MKLLNHINTYQSEADYQNDKSKNFPNVSYIVENDNVLFVKEKTDYSNDYLTFEAIEDGTFTFTGTNSNSLSYSLDDGQTWTALASGTASPTVTAGNKIMWRGTCTPSDNGIGKFSATANFNVQGNIMSLLFGDDFTNQTNLTGKDYAFYDLFYQNTNIKSAKNLILPATTLASNCYYEMFRNCTGLTTAPVLPATTLASNCYYGMFLACTGLTTAPELPATTLAEGCYQFMFFACTNLVNAPVLPATTLASSCYIGMFQDCTNLVTAPELPATTLANNCYQQIFYSCTNLNYIKCLATDISANGCLSNWVYNVASTGTFVKNSAATWNVTGLNGIPEGWTVVTE